MFFFRETGSRICEHGDILIQYVFRTAWKPVFSILTWLDVSCMTHPALYWRFQPPISIYWYTHYKLCLNYEAKSPSPHCIFLERQVGGCEMRNRGQNLQGPGARRVYYYVCRHGTVLDPCLFWLLVRTLRAPCSLPASLKKNMTIWIILNNIT